MPAKIADNWSLEHIEEQIIFTQETLRAVPQTQDLVSELDPWFTMVDETAAAARSFQRKRIELHAQHKASQARLKEACRAFAHELTYKKRAHGDESFKIFFKNSLSRWMNRSFGEVLDSVQSWLKTSHAALEAHRAQLTTLFELSERAHLELKNLAFLRSEFLKTRQLLGQRLTELRDSLHAELAKRAREQRLPRSWSESFFLKSRKLGVAALSES